MKSLFSIILVVTSLVVSSTATSDTPLQCKNHNGNPVNWFMAIKMPKSKWSDGTTYMYLDDKNPTWTYLTGITTTESAIGHTVSQMYATTESYNNSIMWLVYNDEPTNTRPNFNLGHSKGIIVADNSRGYWLMHSVPKFPQLPYQNNFYTYPKTGVWFGQNFLCLSMEAEQLDKLGEQLINNEVLAYGSHFGENLIETYPSLYTVSLPHSLTEEIENDGVRIEVVTTLNHMPFMSISKNRYFGKDLYDDYITHMTSSNLLAETWLNTRDRFNSSCSLCYKTMNIKSLIIKNINGLNNSYIYKSSRDHSKWVITDNYNLPWICIGDINRGLKQTHRGGGIVCVFSIDVWTQYKKLVHGVDSCN